MYERYPDILRVFHVDDDKIFLRLFQTKFGKYFNLTTAGTGEEAIERLKRETFNIILLDYVLPDMNGVELIKKIKKDYPDIIVIFLTGQGNEEVARDAFLAGATDYFSKKIDDFAFREILLNSINKAMRKNTTEKSLIEIKKRHRNIFRLSPEAIVVLDKKGNIVDTNERVFDWLGYTPEEIIGKNIMELPFFPDESKAKVKKNFSQRMTGDFVPPYDLIFINKKEEEVIGRVVAVPIKNDKGEIFQDLVMISNITEQKKAEIKLEESEKKFRRITDLTKDVIFQLDKTGSITYCSPSIEKTLGYTPDEMDSKRIFEYVVPDEASMSNEIFTSMLAGGSNMLFETSALGKSGIPVPIEINATGIEKNGEIIGIQGVARDITFRKKAESEIRKERDRAQKYLDIAGSIILVLDTGGAITLFNRKGSSVLGYSEKEILGKNWFSNFIPGKIRKDTLSSFNKLIQGEMDGSEYIENHVVTKTGDERLIGWYNTVLRNDEGEVTGLLSSGVDVTEMRLAEEALRESRDELEKRVHERTVELLKKNEIMRMQVAARRKAEEKIRSAYEKLREFKSIIDRSPAIVFLWKVAEGWPVEFVSDNVSQFGYSAEDFTSGRISWPGITHPDDVPWLEAELEAYNREKTKEFEQKYRLISKSGEVRWVEDRTRAIMDENGVITHYQGIILDVSEKKRAEEASRRSMELLHLVMDNIPQFVFWKDRNSVFLGCNNNFARVAGVDKPEDIIGKTDYDLAWKKEKSDFYRECDKRIMNTGKPEYYINELQLQPDGTKSWLETNKIPLKDENGEVFGVLGTYDDITERRNKDEELREYREHLEEIVTERTADLQKSNRYLQKEIAERKKAEEALKKSEEKFKDIFENSPISIWQEDFSRVKNYLDELRKQGIEDFSEYFAKHPRELIKCIKMIGINDVNKASLELFEAENKKNLLSGLDRIFCEESHENVIKELVAIAHSDTSFESEIVNMTLTGKKKYVSLKWTVAPGFEKTYKNVLLTIFDITERKADERLIKRRLDFERMISGISSRIIGSENFDSMINYSLEQMGKLSNADRAHLFFMRENQNIFVNTHEWCAEGLEPLIDNIQSLQINKFPWWINELKKGEIIHISDVSKMPDEARATKGILESLGIKSLLALPILIKGELIGFLGFDDTHKAERWKLEDITMLRITSEMIANAIERRIDGESLKRTMIELERSNYELEQFAYIASHDLQEPLRMITSYLALLEKRYGDKLDSNAGDFISYIVDGAERMRGLTNDLLLYSKVSTRTETFQGVDCSNILLQVIQNLEIAIKESGVTINNKPLPVITGDNSQLIQLFQNLISNALKFRRDKNPMINISCKEKEIEYEFSFKDNGIGIDPRFVNEIFLPFRRLHTREEYPGSGIGLAICKKIVEKHGGVIWAESELANGTTFFFTIPIC
ncbi:MAG: PAS domain S-box protein [Candidatus Eremiobacteraeota bacterium]|nr:PAS domain S-box protein [Candidatus Eremiobacteraeota bacterium]